MQTESAEVALEQQQALDGQWTPVPDRFEIRCPAPKGYAGGYDIADCGDDVEQMRARLVELRATGRDAPYTLHRIRSSELQLPD